MSALGIRILSNTSASFRPLDLEEMFDNCFYNFSGEIEKRWYGPYRDVEGFPIGVLQLDWSIGGLHG